MKLIAFSILVASWACLFFWRSESGRLIQAILFAALGLLLALAGGLSYWWDSAMRPSQASGFILFCGIFAALPHVVRIVLNVLEAEGGVPFPRRTGGRRRPPPDS